MATVAAAVAISVAALVTAGALLPGLPRSQVSPPPPPDGGLTVRVVDEARGVTLARLPAQGDQRLELRYVHSVYRQPAVEELEVTPAGLRLVRLASPSAAVMEYYARPEPVRPTAEGYEIRIAPETQAPAPRLELLVGETGRRTVVYAGRELPLHTLAGEGARVSLTVAGARTVAGAPGR